EPALERAVDDRQMLNENEVAGEQRPGGLIERGQIAVGMRRRPGLQFKRPSAQVERHAVGDSEGGGNDLDLIDQLVADDPAKRLEIELAAHGERPGKIAVADKGRPQALE